MSDSGAYSRSMRVHATAAGRAGAGVPGRELYFVASIVVFVLALLTMDSSGSSQRFWMACLLCTVLLVMVGGYNSFRRDVLSPLVFPTAYIWVVVALPWLFVVWTGEELWRISATSIDGPPAALMALTLAGWTIGTCWVVAFKKVAPEPVPVSRDLTRFRRQIRSMAAVLLLVLLGGKIVQVALNVGPYGADQTAYGAAAMLTTVLEGLLPVVVLLSIVGRDPDARWAIGRYEFVVLSAIFGIGMFALGSRSEFLAPLILLLWGQAKRKRITIGKAGVGALLIIPLLAVTAFTRTESEFSRGDLVERSLVDISSPYVIAVEVTDRIPAASPHLGGATYGSTLRFAMPGFIARRIGGDTLDTAAFRYRELVGLTAKGQGMGFSFPAEAYWNWGLRGAFLAAFLVGAGTARSYWANVRGNILQVRTFVYPLVISAIPYAIRSDSLGQFKMVVYPLVILWLVYLVARALSRTPLVEKKQ